MSARRTAVIPAAGLGTRLLPATKAVPKELLPVGDRPAIQHTVEEAVAAGFDHIVLVTSPAKRAVEEHFEPSPELERRLAAAGRVAELAGVRRAVRLASIEVVHQLRPLGLGHAVSLARPLVGSGPFAVLLPDELVVDGGALLRRMADQHHRTGHAVVGLVEVDPGEIERYGCAAIVPPVGAFAGSVTGRVRQVVEKPDRDDAPSDLALCGRYVLDVSIFDALDASPADGSGEIQLTPAVADLATRGRLDGVVTRARRYDLGRRLDYVLANLDLALADPGLAPEVAERLGLAPGAVRPAGAASRVAA